jgi:hypothetical protein
VLLFFYVRLIFYGCIFGGLIIGEHFILSFFVEVIFDCGFDFDFDFDFGFGFGFGFDKLHYFH